MIRLTLNALAEPEIHLFNKSTILIGSENSPVDLILPGVQIQPLHLKITEQSGFLIIINVTNDPFVTVNGHPFGKKLLNSGDVISIHQIEILFETLNAAEQAPQEAELVKAAVPQIAIASLVNPPVFALPFEREVELLQEEELQKLSLDHYFQEPIPSSVDPSPKTAAVENASLENQAVTERPKPTSLKDDYLRDLDDDNHKAREGGPFGQMEESNHLIQAWKWILLFIFSVLAIAGIIGTVMYFSITDKTEAQETKVAQGMADLAMAITHAQVSNLRPNNQNWADVDFLKTNLQAILPHVFSYASEIDAQGQFNCCPYSLRIYTTSNMSHFLLIAQPAPSVLHWLIPKASVIVDSHLMELRTIKDLRTLNRLLANPDPLESLNSKEITQLIKQGELIHLSNLALESNHSDFAPPKNLAWIKQGAENYIYNAPRYYRLGQGLIQKAIALSTSKGTSQEVMTLKQDVEMFAILNPFILYTDQGEKFATLVRQAIKTYAPSDKLLFGYLSLTTQGKIHQAQLLKDDKPQTEEMLTTQDSKENENELIAEAFDTKEAKKADASPLVDVNHPIYIQLQSLVSARNAELKPLGVTLQSLISQEMSQPQLQFSLTFEEASTAFLNANLKHNQLIRETLSALYHQYEEMPIEEFLLFTKALALEQLIHQEQEPLQLVDENCLQNVETLICHIEKSKSLIELDNLIQIASTWLTFDYIKDPQSLIDYQNMLRNQTLEQLKKYLLLQKNPQAITLKLEDRDILSHILSLERLIKPEEKEFFLTEFDELVKIKQAGLESPPSVESSCYPSINMKEVDLDEV
jgi:hypothetical protein